MGFAHELFTSQWWAPSGPRHSFLNGAQKRAASIRQRLLSPPLRHFERPHDFLDLTIFDVSVFFDVFL